MFRLNQEVLEVRGRNERYLPVCFNSSRKDYAERVCSSTGRYLLSYEALSLRTSSSYSIACVDERNCFPYLNTLCKRGVTVKCIIDFCPSDSMPSGRQCVQTMISSSESFAEAKELCSFRVLSLHRDSDRAALMQLMSESFDAGKIYFTSGYRKGSQWLWEDGTPVNFDVGGDGRCLAVVGGSFRAVECDSPGTALCEVARECVYHGDYYGRTNTSQNGLPCMKWNDPSVLFYGVAVDGQANWDHNLCRTVNGEHVPSCFSTPSSRRPCSVPECPDSSTHLELKADLASSKCGVGFFSCADSGRCLPEEFRCDYEPDCKDASDEEHCEDYLKYFELIGTLKLADKITEVWTYIPHTQGCARRCKESTLLCEAFSFEPRTQTCLLTDSSEIGDNLAVKPTSQYYRKRFSSKDVQFDLKNGVLRVAKNNTWANVCDDGFSSDYATSICRIFGYG